MISKYLDEAVLGRMRTFVRLLFWGYQTAHANKACDPDFVRATAPYHFGNPHGQSTFKATVRKLIPR